MRKEGKGIAKDPLEEASVILTGGFHQFGGNGDAFSLYKAEDSQRVQIGRVIFKQFNAGRDGKAKVADANTPGELPIA